MNQKPKNYSHLSFNQKGHLPLYVEFEVSSHCNAKCVFCPREKKNSPIMLKPKLFESVLRKYINYHNDLPDCHPLKNSGFPMFIFAGGGEPLLNKELFNYIKAIHISGFSSWLTTNGTLLNHYNIEAILNSNIDKIEVSCLGINKDEYAASTGLNGFNKVVSNIVNLSNKIKETGKNIDFHVVSYNLKTVKSTTEEVKDFWRSLDVDFLGVLPVINRGGLLKNFSSIIKKTEDIDHFSTPVDFEEDLWCYYPKYFDFINAEGVYLPCSAYFFDDNGVELGCAESDELSDIYARYVFYIKSKSLHKMCRRCFRFHDQWPINEFLNKKRVLNCVNQK